MKKSVKNILLVFLILSFISTVLFAFFGMSKLGNLSAYAATETRIVDESKLNALKEKVSVGGRQYMRVYNEDGDVETFESLLQPEYVDYLSSEIYLRNTNQIQYNTLAVSNPFAVTTIIDNGLPDSESIVVVFMGDGYTAGTGENQQGNWPNPVKGSFLYQANNAAHALINTHPFNLFSNVFKVYAIQAISSEEGISRYPDGNGSEKDTYFGSYVTDPGYISMPSNQQTQALELAKSVSSNVAMVQVLANADVHGGVSFWGAYSDATTVRVSLVATQSISNTYWSTAWHGTVVHEFGHSFGQLMDEHNTSVGRNESRANATQVSDPSTVKWSHWIGYENITVRSVTNGWYVPAKESGGCIMRASWANSKFCAVCAAELTRRMAAISGETFYGKRSDQGPNTPNITIPSSATRILDYAFNGNTSFQDIVIPSNVKEIGDYAFLGATSLTTIVNQSPYPQQINDKTFAGLTRANITVYVPIGKTSAYESAGWTDFKIIEIESNFTISFDKQSGSGGSDSVEAWYGSPMPTATAPTWTGHTFHGYFSERDGNGVQYYDENMQSVRNWDITQNYTLYAHWTVIKYTVSLCYGLNYEDGRMIDVQVAYGDPMPIPSVEIAPIREGYEFVGFYSGKEGKGTKYYSMEIKTERAFNSSTFTYYTRYYEGLASVRSWDHYSDGVLYPYWKPLQCEYTYEDISKGGGEDYILGLTTLQLTHGESLTLTANSYKGYKFLYFWKDNKEYTSSTVTWDIALERYEYDGKVYLKGGFFAVYDEDNPCVATGTLITLADGSQKPVEELTGNEMLLVWNLYTGRFDIAPILFIDREAEAECEVIHLTFSDGTVVKIIGEHGFWDFDLNKYVYLDANAAQYIGHSFNKQTADGWTSVQLVDVTISREVTIAWSPVTYSHLCYYVNGMLSMPGGIDGLFNVFEVDAETMRYDETAMQADIATYGLFTYEEFAELVPVSEEVFAAFNGEYLKVAIGKGLIDIPTLQRLANRYAEFFGNF